MDKDQIYSESMANIANFNFDAQVADVFTDMIERSVPGYRSIITMIETLTGHYALPGSNLYDLGCSLGAATLSMERGLTAENCQIIAVDNSPAMVERCRKAVARRHTCAGVTVIEGDILATEIADASVVVLNFTLQFVPPEERARLLERICAGMRPGGVLILSEKVVFEDEHLDELLAGIHHDFKRAHGYSDLEISQKRSALENVLVPETIPTHRERLLSAGFTSVDVWFQCFNFMSMLAIK
ncbi:Carboxy-S-adenosyl-L-methionine synthase [Pontiella sulfatireligans]|uniref:Carboxy-S-adenosyl-L-methionine synthase n=2 Tax=Pontiella sulfatireligans TaxID=2750658 RepID=A0A6C2UJG8_9BACT|nr:Carboxy-S-adenosyl-L-methionine synthase [Pontiella sulfatireligans]